MSTEDSEADEPLRAVAYVRMSTDRQIYSTENQMDAIAAYAARKTITIVRTYKDDGKSGLLLDRRRRSSRCSATSCSARSTSTAFSSMT